MFALLVAFTAVGQQESGIYLTVQCARKSERHTVAISSKQICLAAHPIILSGEFQAVTDMMEQGDKIWFDVTLSNKALQTLLQLSNNLPNSTFAFMIEQDVFSTFAASDLMVGRTFRFQGTGKNKSVFSDTQKKLKALIDARTQ